MTMNQFKEDLKRQIEIDKKRFSECFGETYDFSFHSAGIYIDKLQSWIRNWEEHNEFISGDPADDQSFLSAVKIGHVEPEDEFKGLDELNGKAPLIYHVGEDDGLQKIKKDMSKQKEIET